MQIYLTTQLCIPRLRILDDVQIYLVDRRKEINDCLYFKGENKMIKIENAEVVGFEHAIKGMRNPMNSWNKMDSYTTGYDDSVCPTRDDAAKKEFKNVDNYVITSIGPNDGMRMEALCKSGADHRKFMRMITVYIDITAPLYWWKEFDTYKVGTVANSCSTMHKISDKEFELSDFSHEHLDCYGEIPEIRGSQPHDYNGTLFATINALNHARRGYLKHKDKQYWWQMIQLLPSSYNQKRTIMLNYEVLTNMYHSRKKHKLDEWRAFCEWVETLPYSGLITGDALRKHEMEVDWHD